MNYENITEEEIIEIAKRSNKSIEEVRNDLKYSIRDLQFTNKMISNIITDYCYSKVGPEYKKFNYKNVSEFKSKYLCSYNLIVGDYNSDDTALVTGFGPTNAPTAGTISMIQRIIEIQKNTGFYTHIIISDLGALNSRQKDLNSLLLNTKRFKKFITLMGFNNANGVIRTHNYFDLYRTFAIVSSQLKSSDLKENSEVTEEMYKRLNKQGNDFSTMVDQTFTVADILLPIVRDKKKNVIVCAGIEEHYYPFLANIVLQRMKQKSGGIEEFVDDNSRVSALYTQIIPGFFPYVKMSKSIPESAITLNDDEEVIKDRILNCTARNEEVILKMMELSSGWDAQKINKAKNALKQGCKSKLWIGFKKEYYEYFIYLRKLWQDSSSTEGVNCYDEVFKCQN